MSDGLQYNAYCAGTHKATVFYIQKDQDITTQFTLKVILYYYCNEDYDHKKNTDIQDLTFIIKHFLIENALKHLRCTATSITCREL